MRIYAKLLIEVMAVITYDPFWKMLKEKNISSYKLEKEYGWSKSMIYKFRHNQNVTLETVNQICKIFHCDLWDVIAYVEDEE